jgi:nitroimidazol reductase NimA-like FMN-containing flavoprotein (pyridoxamine 5'-phosphate oxidase superfamily)
MTTESDGGVYADTTSRRTEYIRRSDQARYDAQAINSVLDEAIMGHVAYVDGDEPVAVPVVHTRDEQNLYLLTSAQSRLARLAGAKGGTKLCVTVSLLEGLVLARSQVGHGVNYRSVVARGSGRLITDPGEKRAALSAGVEHLLAGRSRHSRPPTDQELAELGIVRMPLDDVALKARTGPPIDEPGDLALWHWAGTLGVRTEYGPPFPSPDLPYDRQLPNQIANYSRSAKPQNYR